MRRPALRALMAVVGIGTLAVYLAGAYAAYTLLAMAWELRPDLPTLALALLSVTFVSAYVSYQVGTARILRQVNATPLPREQAPALYRRIAAYSDQMGIDPPDVLLADVGQPNALALGGGLGAGNVVVDRRLLRLLSFDELSAIVAHELAHLERRDSLIQTFGYSLLQTVSGLLALPLLPVFVLAAGLARGVAWIRGQPHRWAETLPGRLARAVGGLAAVSLFGLTLALRAHSRRREFAADDRAAEVTGDPLALARALRKIERATTPPWELLSSLYVRGDEDGTLTRMLSTHPDTEERVERLRRRADASDRGRRIRIE